MMICFPIALTLRSIPVILAGRHLKGAYPSIYEIVSRNWFIWMDS